MPITMLNPYLSLRGNAQKAIEHYQRALGAKIEAVTRFSEVPGMKTSPEHAQRVIHAMLQIGAGVLMMTDAMPDPTLPVKQGGNVDVCLNFDDPAELTQRFNALAEGGTVTMAIHDTFYGGRLGCLTDAFGVQWMFNCMKS